jgi:hypothetical protein
VTRDDGQPLVRRRPELEYLHFKRRSAASLPVHPRCSGGSSRQGTTAGTYVFKLSDSQSNRNIVQIFDKDEKQLLATILAIRIIGCSPPINDYQL